MIDYTAAFANMEARIACVLSALTFALQSVFENRKPVADDSQEI